MAHSLTLTPVATKHAALEKYFAEYQGVTYTVWFDTQYGRGRVYVTETKEGLGLVEPHAHTLEEALVITIERHLERAGTGA